MRLFSFLVVLFWLICDISYIVAVQVQTKTFSNDEHDYIDTQYWRVTIDIVMFVTMIWVLVHIKQAMVVPNNKYRPLMLPALPNLLYIALYNRDRMTLRKLDFNYLFIPTMIFLVKLGLFIFS